MRSKSLKTESGACLFRENDAAEGGRERANSIQGGDDEAQSSQQRTIDFMYLHDYAAMYYSEELPM